MKGYRSAVSDYYGWKLQFNQPKLPNRHQLDALRLHFLEDKMYVGVRCRGNMKKHTIKDISITTPYTFILKLWISNDVVERGLRNGCTPKKQLNETLVKVIQGCGLSIIHHPRKCIVHVKTYRKGNKILLDKTIENKYWALLGNKRYYNAQ